MTSQVRYALVLIGYVRFRAAEARRNGRHELGASAIEWAIISAIVVGLAVVVAAVVRNVVDQNTDEINNQNDQLGG